MKPELIAELQQNPSPQRLSDILLQLSAEYAYVSSQFEAVCMEKPTLWEEMRKTTKSDKQAEILWDKTENGKNETAYRLRLKSLEKVMSAIKTMLRVKENEARNFY